MQTALLFVRLKCVPVERTESLQCFKQRAVLHQTTHMRPDSVQTFFVVMATDAHERVANIARVTRNVTP